MATDVVAMVVVVVVVKSRRVPCLLAKNGVLGDRKVSTGPGAGLEGLPGPLLRSVDVDFLRRIQP